MEINPASLKTLTLLFGAGHSDFRPEVTSGPFYLLRQSAVEIMLFRQYIGRFSYGGLQEATAMQRQSFR
jgi:hypothetical protein